MPATSSSTSASVHRQPRRTAVLEQCMLSGRTTMVIADGGRDAPCVASNRLLSTLDSAIFKPKNLRGSRPTSYERVVGVACHNEGPSILITFSSETRDSQSWVQSIHSIALKQDASKVEAVEASHLAKSIPGCRSLHDDIRSGVQIRRNTLGSNLSMLDHGGMASLSAASRCVVTTIVLDCARQSLGCDDHL